MTTIVKLIHWVKKHKRIAVEAVLSACVAFSLMFGINTYTTNKKLSEQLEMAQNNVEAYQGALDGSQQAFNVIKLDMETLAQQNDSIIRELDKIRKENKIKSSELTTAATQTQTLNVNKSKGVRGDIIEVLKDTVYTDSLKYNDLTKVYYSIGKDSVNIAIDLQNTQYLYIYKTKEYKHKKNIIKRILTFDFKKIYKYKYKIINTNDLLKEDDVRIIEST